MIVNQRSIKYFRLTSDLVLLNIIFLLSAIFAQSWQILISRNYMFILQIILNIIWVFSANFTNFYDDFNLRYFAYQFINIIKIVLVQALTAIIFIFITKEDLFTRNFILYYSFMLVIFVSIRIITFKVILRNLRARGKNIRNLLILGAGEVGRNFYDLINENPDFGYNFIGFLETGDENEQSNKIIGNYDQLEKIIKEKKVEEVVIAIPETSSKLLDEIIKTCNRNAVKTHIIPDYFRFVSKKFKVSMIGNFPIITARNEPLDEVQWRLIKRLFDIIFSLLVILLIYPWLFPLIAIIIKLDSKGPVFFKQERIGVKNQKFIVYKFRTLKHISQVEHENKFVPVQNEDPRITRSGRLLRRTNLDEIPQFINVLKGEMSIVGPRPHAIPYDKKYSTLVDEIKLRHNVKPGITGWAQIHGLRGDVFDEEENNRRTIKRIQYDIWYIENWTFWLDIQIILLTVWQMIKGKAKGT